MSDETPIKVGDDAPDFDLPSSTSGEKFKLSDYKGKNAIVINFVPAAFSPVCSNQLPLIEAKVAEFASQDAIPVVVSVDNTWSQAAWKKELGVSFAILADFNPKGAVSQAYDSFIASRGISNRKVIVVDKHGKVAWIEAAVNPGQLPDYDPIMSCSKG